MKDVNLSILTLQMLCQNVRGHVLPKRVEWQNPVYLIILENSGFPRYISKKIVENAHLILRLLGVERGCKNTLEGV